MPCPRVCHGHHEKIPSITRKCDLFTGLPRAPRECTVHQASVTLSVDLPRAPRECYVHHASATCRWICHVHHHKRSLSSLFSLKMSRSGLIFIGLRRINKSRNSSAAPREDSWTVTGCGPRAGLRFDQSGRIESHRKCSHTLDCHSVPSSSSLNSYSSVSQVCRYGHKYLCRVS